MRQERIIQASIFDVFAGHEIGRELEAISRWLDEHRSVLSLVIGDLRRHGIQETGRRGLPAEAVLRCALLKQYRLSVITGDSYASAWVSQEFRDYGIHYGQLHHS